MDVRLVTVAGLHVERSQIQSGTKMIRTQIEEPVLLLASSSSQDGQQESAVEAGVYVGCIEIQNFRKPRALRRGV